MAINSTRKTRQLRYIRCNDITLVQYGVKNKRNLTKQMFLSGLQPTTK